jgi:hypothetical protein
VTIIGGVLFIMGIGATATSMGRWISGYKQLKAREDDPQSSHEAGSIMLKSPPKSAAEIAQADSRAA